jgi:hypothetical protein
MSNAEKVTHSLSWMNKRALTVPEIRAIWMANMWSASSSFFSPSVW